MLYLACCRQSFSVFLFVREVIRLFTTLGKTLTIQNMLTYRKNLQCFVHVLGLGMFGECWDGILIHRIFRCDLCSVLFIFIFFFHRVDFTTIKEIIAALDIINLFLRIILGSVLSSYIHLLIHKIYEAY